MLWWLVQNTITVAGLALVVALICRAARLSPAARHVLWLVILLKFLTPPLVHWPWEPHGSWAAWNRGHHRTDAEDSPVPRPDPSQLVSETGGDWPVYDGPPDRGELQTTLGFEAPELGTVASQAAKLSTESLAPVDHRQDQGASLASGIQGRFNGRSWLRMLLSIWVLGGVLAVLRLVRKLIRFRRLLGCAQDPPQWLRWEAFRLSRTLGVEPPLTLVVSGICSPMLWCLGHPRLLWPRSLVEGVDPEEWRGVVAHELAHLRRRDHWICWLELVAELIWWWNPLFWYVRRQLDENAELACDAWVLWAVPEGRRAYAEALVQVSQVLSQTAAPAPALGMGTGAQNAFRRRLTMILCERVARKSSLGVWIGAGLLGMAALPAWSPGEDPPAPPAAAAAVSASTEPSPPAVAGAQAPATPAVPAATALPIQPIPNQPRLPEALPAAPASPVPVVNAGPVDAPGDQDGRIRQLEAKLEALLQEVRALRSGTPEQAYGSGGGVSMRRPIGVPGRSPGGADSDSGRAGTGASGRIGSGGYGAVTGAGGAAMTAPNVASARKTSPAQALYVHDHSISADADVETLIRAKYELPRAKAEALVAFLGEHVNAEIDAKVDGDQVIITATPDVQRNIGQLIAFMQGKPSAEPRSTRSRISR
jgi:beta-lactamase regulating signal transducer with metallopeptidase domain